MCSAPDLKSLPLSDDPPFSPQYPAPTEDIQDTPSSQSPPEEGLSAYHVQNCLLAIVLVIVIALVITVLYLLLSREKVTFQVMLFGSVCSVVSKLWKMVHRWWVTRPLHDAELGMYEEDGWDDKIESDDEFEDQNEKWEEKGRGRVRL